ncbi:MAG TPA: hypothetical protein VJG90_05635 [Candidatus Nanoarchaeia archaeon]|nr:hypothetical protein [Candidatus Nanoarchaeia archaeon]
MGGSESKDCSLEIRAGPGGENSDVYAYVHSTLPSWIRTVDDPLYRLPVGLALEAAKQLARDTGRDLTLNFSLTYRL